MTTAEDRDEGSNSSDEVPLDELAVSKQVPHPGARARLAEDLRHLVDYGWFLAQLLLHAVLDGLLLLGAFYWQIWVNDVMDLSKLKGADRVLFEATRITLGTSPFIITLAYSVIDMMGTIKRLWARR